MQKSTNEGIILFICDILATLFHIYIKKSTDKNQLNFLQFIFEY